MRRSPSTSKAKRTARAAVTVILAILFWLLCEVAPSRKGRVAKAKRNPIPRFLQRQPRKWLPQPFTRWAFGPLDTGHTKK